MRLLRRYGADLFILAGFFFLPFLLYGAVTVGSKTMLPVDNLFQWAPWQGYTVEFGATFPHNSLLTDLIIENYAWKRFAINSLQAGEIPLWNPNLFAGAPFLANGQHGMLYPFSWIFFLVPAAKAYGWYTILQLWLAGASMYIFGRVLHMRRGSAAVAGLIYQGSGFLLASAAVFPMIIGAAAWLPFLLAAIEKIVTSAVLRYNKTLIWMALGAVALGLQILAGHIEITYYTLLIMALFWKEFKLFSFDHGYNFTQLINRQPIRIIITGKSISIRERFANILPSMSEPQSFGGLYDKHVVQFERQPGLILVN